MGGQKVYEKQLLILLPEIVGCLLNPVFFFSILVGELVIYDNFQWEDKSFFFSILVAARSNRGLSFVGSAGRELGEGSLMVRPHLCKSAVRAGDNQGLHTITPTHLSSGETSDAAAHQLGLHLADKGRQQRIIIWQSRKVGFCVILNVTPALYCRSHISLSKLC